MTDPIQPPLQSNEPQGPQNPQLPPADPSKPNDFGMSPNTWAMLTHLSGLLGYLGNVVGSAIGPLIFWLIKKDSMPGMDAHGKEALNFNISILIYMLILLVVTIILLIPTIGLFWFVGMGLMSLLGLVHIILVIVAAMKAAAGEFYRYPMTIRLIK